MRKLRPQQQAILSAFCKIPGEDVRMTARQIMTAIGKPHLASTNDLTRMADRGLLDYEYLMPRHREYWVTPLGWRVYFILQKQMEEIR